MKKILGIAGLTLAFLVFTAPLAFGAEFIAPDKDSGNITLSKDETHKNVYITGGSVFINSNITGDLYGAGGTATVEGTVEQDVVFAGGTITLNGQIGGDIRVAGGTITINAPVGGDIIMAGGTVHLTEKASVAGDLVIAGGDITIEGPIAGSVKIAGGSVTVNSTITGKVNIQADQSLTFGSKAVVANSITYKGIDEAVVKDGAQVSSIDFEKLSGRQGQKGVGRMFVGLFTIAFLIKAVGLIITGLLLMKLFPRASQDAVLWMQRGMWTNLGIGFLTLILGPIVVVILLLTILGIYIAFLAFLVWLILLILAALTASVFTGAWVLKVLTSRREMRYDWQSLVIGVVVLLIISIVPVVGFLACLILVLMGYGGMIRQFYARIKTEQQSSGSTGDLQPLISSPPYSPPPSNQPPLTY